LIIELIKLIKCSFIVALTKLLSAFLEDELLGEQGAMAANAVIDIKDQLCEDRG